MCNSITALWKKKQKYATAVSGINGEKNGAEKNISSSFSRKTASVFGMQDCRSHIYLFLCKKIQICIQTNNLTENRKIPLTNVSYFFMRKRTSSVLRLAAQSVVCTSQNIWNQFLKVLHFWHKSTITVRLLGLFPHKKSIDSFCSNDILYFSCWPEEAVDWRRILQHQKWNIKSFENRFGVFSTSTNSAGWVFLRPCAAVISICHA